MSVCGCVGVWVCVYARAADEKLQVCHVCVVCVCMCVCVRERESVYVYVCACVCVWVSAADEALWLCGICVRDEALQVCGVCVCVCV